MSIMDLRSNSENGITKERYNLQVLMMSILSSNGYECEEYGDLGCLLFHKKSCNALFTFDVFSCTKKAVAYKFKTMALKKFVKPSTNYNDMKEADLCFKLALGERSELISKNYYAKLECQKGVNSINNAINIMHKHAEESEEGTPAKEASEYTAMMLEDVSNTMKGYVLDESALYAEETSPEIAKSSSESEVLG